MIFFNLLYILHDRQSIDVFVSTDFPFKQFSVKPVSRPFVYSSQYFVDSCACVLIWQGSLKTIFHKIAKPVCPRRRFARTRHLVTVSRYRHVLSGAIQESSCAERNCYTSFATFVTQPSDARGGAGVVWGEGV